MESGVGAGWHRSHVVCVFVKIGSFKFHHREHRDHREKKQISVNTALSVVYCFDEVPPPHHSKKARTIFHETLAKTDIGYRWGRILGSHLCERLVVVGDDVLCVDNYFID